KRSLTVSQWAEQNRVIASGTNLPGPWRNDNAPHLTEIMDCLSEHSPVRQVTYKKSSGVGGTEVLWNWMGYLIDHVESKDVMMVVPTLDLRDREFNPQFNKMLKETPALANKVTTKPRDSANRQDLTEFGHNARLIKTGANSADGLRSSHLPYVMCDEVSGFPWDVGGEGDPVTLIENRQKTFTRFKRLYISTPTNANECRITTEYEKSDQRQRHVPCPHCGHMHTLAFKNFHWEYAPDSLGDNAKRKMVDHAWFECPKCHKRIDEHQKNTMLDQGKWIPKYPHIRHHRGYHINAFYIKYGLGKTWADIAQEWVDAQHDDSKLKSVVNTYLGEVWEDKGEGVEAVTLLSRLEAFGPVFDAPQPPKVVRVAGVDVQKDRFEATIVDFEDSEEGWTQQHLIIPGDTALDESWDALSDELAEWQVQIACIDSGYQADQVYAFCAKRRWCTPIKGMPGMARPLIEDQVKRRQRLRRRRKKGMPVEPLGVDQGKALIYARLKMDSPTTYEVDEATGEITASQREPRPGFIHFKNDACFDDEYFAQLTAEKLVTKKRSGREIQEWVKGRPRNEALDCMVYALAAFRLSKGKGAVTQSNTSQTTKTTRTGQKTTRRKPQKPASGGKLF
ncbi:MAG: phage terminase large subunit family protein, partial [Hydrogenovibrio sp.]|uniref:phage terminase large subunit family protein n=1 Tax=Hydrogenovibrio sp. TaxID=2065821 RepID=UPI0028700D16